MKPLPVRVSVFAPLPTTMRTGSTLPSAGSGSGVASGLARPATREQCEDDEVWRSHGGATAGGALEERSSPTENYGLGGLGVRAEGAPRGRDRRAPHQILTRTESARYILSPGRTPNAS